MSPSSTKQTSHSRRHGVELVAARAAAGGDHGLEHGHVALVLGRDQRVAHRRGLRQAVERRAVGVADQRRARHREQVGHRQPDRVADRDQVGHRRRRRVALDLGQEALGQARAGLDVGEREPPRLARVAQPGASIRTEPRASTGSGWRAFIGIAVTAVTLPLMGPIVDLFGPGDRVSALAVTYLRIALLGTVPLLLMLAATGVLRGLQDTRTPLVVAVAGNLVNIVLNIRARLYGVGLGIAGSALGHPAGPGRVGRWRSKCGWSSGQREGSPRRCARISAGSGRGRSRRHSLPLICGTLMLPRVPAGDDLRRRAELGSKADLAAMQLALTIWTFLAFALDAAGLAARRSPVATSGLPTPNSSWRSRWSGRTRSSRSAGSTRFRTV